MSIRLRGLTRRALLPAFTGLTAAAGAIFSGFGKSASEGGFISEARAEGSGGVRANQGNLAHIKGASAPAQRMAEWADAGPGRGPNSVAASSGSFSRAPANASRYEAKLFNFPCGALRVLTFGKGSPVHHQITFETEIFVLQGSATLIPLRGLSGKPTKVSAGDALFLPSGILTDPQAHEDFVILQAIVGNPLPGAKQSIVTAKQAQHSEQVQWRQDGKAYSATTPEEIKAAPANASRYGIERYVFDGNSFRVATLKKGTRTNMVAPSRSDVLMYVVKGRGRRTEDNEIFDLVAGDAFRERMGKPGSWEALDDLILVATDAPVNVGAPGSGWTAAVAAASREGTTLYEMGIDHNNRSTVGVITLPMQRISDLESISAKQDAVEFRIGYRTFFPRTRTHPDYQSDSGPFSLGVGGSPHFVARMVGGTENTMQDGSVFRQTAGEFVYVRPGSLHHSNQVGFVPGVVMNVVLPGTEDDTHPLVVK